MDFTGGNDLGTLALGLVIAGAVAGFANGAIGIGGGLVLVPSLYLVLGSVGVTEDARAHIAVGTALAALTLAGLTMLAVRTAKFDWRAARGWGAALLIGAVAGAILTAVLAGHILILIFAALALALAAVALLVKSDPPEATRPRIVPALGLGALSVVAGGGLDAMLLRFVTRQDGTIFAVAVALIGTIGAMIAGLAAQGLPEHSLGYVNLLGLAVIAPSLIGGVVAGHHFADAIDAKRLRVTFALFVAVIAAKMLWDVWG